MDIPNYKDSRDMVLCGVMASEVVDSSGEICSIKGMNIETLEAGKGVCNYEHLGAAEGGGSEVVGKITYCKKIYKENDCDTPEQKKLFKKVRGKPYLYGEIRLADGAGHVKAIDLAAHIRDQLHHDGEILLGLSIEGSTIEKKDNVIVASIARRVALTFTPCNKTAVTMLLKDPRSPFNKTELAATPSQIAKTELTQNPQYKKLGGTALTYNPILNSNSDSTLLHSLTKSIATIRLLKTLAAGSTDAAPSTLTGGAALQREDLPKIYTANILAATRDYQGYPFKRDKFKEHLKKYLAKAQLPPIADSFLDHFTDVAEASKLKKSARCVKTPELTNLLHKTFELENSLISLRKSIRDVVEGKSGIEMPEVYKVTMHEKGKPFTAGRFMISNGQLYHLEDYHGLIDALLPEGPVTPETISKVKELMRSPLFNVQEHKLPVDSTPSTLPSVPPTPEPQKLSAEKLPAPERAGIFSYFRPGMSQPHTVEFGPNGAALDGNALSSDELALMLENARKGLAVIKWNDGSSLAKREPTEDLMDADEALQHIRSAVKAGHIHPSVERAITKHIYEDPMVQGVGNKYAAQQFRKQNTPGVYASLDGNSFKHINDTFGHDAGDDAIRGLGEALRTASQKAGTTKVFRPGGDEFLVHAPTHEAMATLLHHARNNVDALPPIGGTHKQSFAVGLGHNFARADEALGIAKAKKLDPITGQKLYKPGAEPNLGHSLYPGNEGELFKPAVKPPKTAIEAPKVPAVPGIK